MTLYTPPYEYLPIGPYLEETGNVSTEEAYLIDSSTDYIAWCLHAPAAGPLTDVLLRITTLNGTQPNYILEQLGMSAGVPGGSVAASQVFSPSSAGDLVVTIGSPATVTLGQEISLRLRHDSGTIGASNRAWFRYAHRVFQSMPTFPSAMYSSNSGSNWTKSSSYGYALAFKIDGQWYGRPLGNGALVNGGSGLTVDGHACGMKFQLDPNKHKTEEIIGFRHMFGLSASTGNHVLKLLDASNSVLASRTISNVQMNSFSPFEELFGTAVTLDAGVDYRIVTERAGTSFYSYYLTLPGAAYRSAYPGLANGAYCENLGAGWVDYTDRMQPCLLISRGFTTEGGSFVASPARKHFAPSVHYSRRFALITQPASVTQVTNVFASGRSRQVQAPAIRYQSRQLITSTVDRQVVIPSPARRERTMAVIPHRRREFVPSVVDRQIVVPAASKRERATSIVALPRLRYLTSIVDRQVVIPGAPRREHRTATVVDRRRELITSREQVIVPTAPRRDHRSTTILARHRELITSRNDVLVPAPARRHPIHTTSTRLARKLLPYETIRTEQVPLPQRPRVIVRTVQVPRRQLVAGALLASIVTTTNVVMVQSRRTVR